MTITIDHVNEIIGDVPFTTSVGNQFSSVFVPLVKEYLDVVETGSFEETIKYDVSLKVALEVKDNIKNLASKIKGLPEDAFIPNLKSLPVELYDLIGKYEWLILAAKVPVSGSKERQEYEQSLLSFRRQLTFIVSSAFGLPNILTQDVKQYSVAIKKLAEVPTGKSFTHSLKSVVALNSLPAVTTMSFLASGAHWSMYIGTLLSTFILNTGVLGALGVLSECSDSIWGGSFAGKNRNKEYYILFLKSSKTVKKVNENFYNLTEEIRSSMKSYLLQNAE